MSNPTLVRNVAVVGHIHHRKTLFMDMLVEQTHYISTFDQNSERHLRYTDTRIDEQERRISIKSVPMSLVLEDNNSKSFLCNIMDAPDHVNFSDEMTAALGLTDGAVLIVDAVDGVMPIQTAEVIHMHPHTLANNKLLLGIGLTLTCNLRSQYMCRWLTTLVIDFYVGVVALSMELPEWSDIVKAGKQKELALYDSDWYYIRAAEGGSHLVDSGILTKLLKEFLLLVKRDEFIQSYEYMS
ncbi:hypothetical protein H5410_040769 [Solanum commersonii]|uniref:Tr-type G domain-containing protein n=1 Tax=Solanum commersonii TaxID=4109 RepID=A0A9J5XRT8_SOLCO|nr:hypothetical protein H5410_040769 [Solanum commersonii]